jgi:hypothetical protein
MLIWRKGTQSPKVSALLDVLAADQNANASLRKRSQASKRRLDA